MHMRVTNAKSACQGFKAGVGHLVYIPERAINNGADAAEGAMHVAVHARPKTSR